jgi:hypothetical protein
MAFDIIHAARRAEMAAVVVHGHAMAGQCDFKDVETLCAAVMQLSQCCMYISAALAESGATTRFDDSEILLGRGILPAQHAKAIRDHFRESFEGPRSSEPAAEPEEGFTAD